MLFKARVSECQQRVHDLLDLQLCCDGVQMSMTNGDFEKAAAHIHRYLSMDQRLLEKTADDVNQGIRLDSLYHSINIYLTLNKLVQYIKKCQPLIKLGVVLLNLPRT